MNLMPLFCGAHMNHIASACGIHHDRYSRSHMWLGVVVIVEVALHTILVILQGNSLIHNVAGSVASGSVATIALFSLPVIQRWMFELFTNLHTLLAIVTLGALWLHLPPTPLQEGPRLPLLISTAVFIAIKLLKLLNILYSNLSVRHKSIASIRTLGSGVEIQIRMARPLKFQAGQYIYLSLWGLSTFSAFEFHPFQICWSFQEERGRQVLILLAQPRRGFTRKLLGPGLRHEYRAFVEGPYGKPLSLGQYGTVLLLATGVGIAGQLAYIKELLKLHAQCDAKIRRIALFWELDDDVYRLWVKELMDELLKCDSDHILDMQIFIRGHFLSTTASEGDVEEIGEHGRLTLTYDSMHPDILVNSEMKKRKGMTLISLCTNPKMARTVMEIVGKVCERDIHVKVLDFQPWGAKGR
ncbi:hypothetical protein F5Y13DRAFT_185764 [Hypoxylon sp. FL1857]|nr:hypothetical protein F5Y13DRAFT_185764 [Hypoxylon sp. FL1857]